MLSDEWKMMMWLTAKKKKKKKVIENLTTNCTNIQYNLKLKKKKKQKRKVSNIACEEKLGVKIPNSRLQNNLLGILGKDLGHDGNTQKMSSIQSRQLLTGPNKSTRWSESHENCYL